VERIETVEMRGIGKSFVGVRANHNVNLTVNAGDILGLLGENGAGKTTLMNILYGLYQPDEGEVYINGKPVQLKSPRESMHMGIGMIHQHFMLIQKHTVLDNIILGFDDVPFFFPQKVMRKQILEFSDKFGLQVNPDKRVWELSAGEQQRVEIIKALLHKADLLIMDEPTSVLTPGEADELFAILRRLSEGGHTSILISHKLDEIMSICNRVLVMRKGEVTGQASIDSVTEKSLAHMMVGREISLQYPKMDLEPGTEVLKVNNLKVNSDQGLSIVNELSFSIRKNEIMGIAGVSGNGQREMVEAITGLRPVLGGSIELNGEDITNKSARHIHDKGMTHVPEERIKFGSVANLLLLENSILKQHHTQPFSIKRLMSYTAIREHAQKLVEDFRVDAASINTPIKNLSGGNMQKLILGREISVEPDLLIAAHPTYGLDVGAADYIRRRLIECRDGGDAVLLVSEDLEELFQVCDRVAVMFEGNFMGIVDPKTCQLSDVGLMMAGSLPKEDK
jgi:ABC-type uncharacterized transport system ATPase subunit